MPEAIAVYSGVAEDAVGTAEEEDGALYGGTLEDEGAGAMGTVYSGMLEEAVAAEGRVGGVGFGTGVLLELWP